MFCPDCRYEYREGFYLCSDCNVGLIDKLEEKPPEIIKPSLHVYKASLKRCWIALGIAAGLYIMANLLTLYYDLLPDYLLQRLDYLDMRTIINLVFPPCLSSLLIYAAYKGFRYIRPFGGVFVFAGLSVIAGLALILTAYTVHEIVDAYELMVLADKLGV